MPWHLPWIVATLVSLPVDVHMVRLCVQLWKVHRLNSPFQKWSIACISNGLILWLQVLQKLCRGSNSCFIPGSDMSSICLTCHSLYDTKKTRTVSQNRQASFRRTVDSISTNSISDCWWEKVKDTLNVKTGRNHISFSTHDICWINYLVSSHIFHIHSVVKICIFWSKVYRNTIVDQ